VARWKVVVDFKNNFNNAFWNGQFMVFGNGDGSAFSDLAKALDVTAARDDPRRPSRTPRISFTNGSRVR
jgi:hypothetical protein